jgi:hypothetical protein
MNAPGYQAKRDAAFLRCIAWSLGTCAALLALAGTAQAYLSASRRLAAASIDALPHRMLWAWERAEDLRWLPPDVGVAYVAVDLELNGGRVDMRERAHPLRVRADTALVPVVHIDLSSRHAPDLDSGQHAAVVAQLLRAAARGNRGVVQLDFEARQSQRHFLAAIVREAHVRLPRGTALSITALASWCAGDRWLDALPADEIVPMAFRMAADDTPIRRLLASTGQFPAPRCRNAIGTATDEPPVAAIYARHYYFSPSSWTPQQWQLQSAQ